MRSQATTTRSLLSKTRQIMTALVAAAAAGLRAAGV
jgi:D-aminopeptidase